MATSHRTHIMLCRSRYSIVARTVLSDVEHFDLRFFSCLFPNLFLRQSEVVSVLDVRMLVKTDRRCVAVDVVEGVRVFLLVVCFTNEFVFISTGHSK
jgi:hypothetical protein